MRKYGIEHFCVQLIEETNNPEEREKFWIEYYGSFKNGYNATIGGDGKRYCDYDLIICLYNKDLTIKDICKLTKYDYKTVSKVLNAFKTSSLDYIIRGHKSLYKKVAKIDKHSKKIVKIYSSISEAEKENGNTKHISDVCNGKRKTCKGYIWQYIN